MDKEIRGFYGTISDEMTDKRIIKMLDWIVCDLSDRRGLGQEWEQIDEKIQSEILMTWYNIIKDNI